MFDRMDTRLWIMLSWIVMFTTMVLVFNTNSMSKEEIIGKITAIEESVAAKDWTKASQHMKNLHTQWQQKRIIGLIHAGDEEIDKIDKTMSQIELLIKYKDPQVVEPLGILKQQADSLVGRVFSGFRGV